MCVCEDAYIQEVNISLGVTWCFVCRIYSSPRLRVACQCEGVTKVSGKLMKVGRKVKLASEISE